MNKYFAWLPVLTIVGSLIYQRARKAHEEKAVDKSISFTVYKSNSYTSEVYNNTSAQVHIIIEKISKTGSTLVCDTLLNTKLLKDYPAIEKAQYQRILIPNINESKEHLEVKYILTYNSKGNELQMQDGTVVSNNMTRLDIDI